MTRPHYVLPMARDDLSRQADYLATQSLPLARRFYEATEQTFAKLALLPDVGTRVKHVKPPYQDVRVWQIEGFPNHLAFYRPTNTGIEIVRVLHGAMDWQRLIGY